MEVGEVSRALRERLGADATVGLVALLESSREEWAQDVTSQAVERFEGRLTTEIRRLGQELRGEMGHLRDGLQREMRDGDAHLRDEMRDKLAAVRLEMREGDAAIRIELRDMGVAVVREIAGLGSTLRQEMADQRVELLKWSFAFWVAQFVSIGGLMTILLRSFLP